MANDFLQFLWYYRLSRRLAKPKQASTSTPGSTAVTNFEGMILRKTIPHPPPPPLYVMNFGRTKSPKVNIDERPFFSPANFLINKLPYHLITI